jgi:hypothetical protein
MQNLRKTRAIPLVYLNSILQFLADVCLNEIPYSGLICHSAPYHKEFSINPSD